LSLSRSCAQFLLLASRPHTCSSLLRASFTLSCFDGETLVCSSGRHSMLRFRSFRRSCRSISGDSEELALIEPQGALPSLPPLSPLHLPHLDLKARNALLFRFLGSRSLFHWISCGRRLC